MNFYLATAFNFSITLPGILALFFFRKIGKRYYPFIFCLWIGCLNETLSLWLILHKQHTLVNSNIYVLVESLLLTWFFKAAGILNTRGKFALIALLLILAWVTENFLVGNIKMNSTYFRIFASMLIVGLSVQLISRVVFELKQNILVCPEFILCACFIIYFGFKAIIQSFAIYAWTRDINFLAKVYYIMLYINLGVNLLYILAVLWMPRKVQYISPSL